MDSLLTSSMWIKQWITRIHDNMHAIYAANKIQANYDESVAKKGCKTNPLAARIKLLMKTLRMIFDLTLFTLLNMIQTHYNDNQWTDVGTHEKYLSNESIWFGGIAWMWWRWWRWWAWGCRHWRLAANEQILAACCLWCWWWVWVWSWWWWSCWSGCCKMKNRISTLEKWK